MPRSNWACEPQLLSLRVWSLCSATREATIVRGPRTAMKSGPRLPQLEKALAQKRRPNIAINQSINQKEKKKTTIASHGLWVQRTNWYNFSRRPFGNVYWKSLKVLYTIQPAIQLLGLNSNKIILIYIKIQLKVYSPL